MIFVIHNMLCTVYSSHPCFSMAPSRDLSKLDVTNRRPHAERRTAIFELNLTEFFIATGDPTVLIMPRATGSSKDSDMNYSRRSIYINYGCLGTCPAVYPSPSSDGFSYILTSRNATVFVLNRNLFSYHELKLGELVRGASPYLVI